MKCELLQIRAGTWNYSINYEGLSGFSPKHLIMNNAHLNMWMHTF